MAKQQSSPYLIGFLGIAILVAVLVGIWKIPQSQVGAAPLKQEEKNRIDAETAARLALIQGVGGLLFFGTAAISFLNLRATQRNVEIAQKNALIAEEKQVTERFSKAIEMLGNENSIHIRLGGIYALERIANDSDKDYWQVMEVLTAYVRERSPRNLSSEQESWEEDEIPLPSTDIQAVLTVIGRRKHSYGNGEVYGLDLRGTDLRGVDLKTANLQRSNLSDANLQGAHLSGGSLQQANFSGGNLRRVDLSDANLNKAIFINSYLQKSTVRNSHLQRAIFVNSHLQEADLHCANLEEADLSSANLHGISLWGANLQKVDFLGANLQEAELVGANLQGAILRYTNLKDANLEKANLKKTKLIWKQLSLAKTYEGAELPDHLIENQPPALKQ